MLSKTCVLIFAILVSPAIEAMDYVKASVGIGKLMHVSQDGWWHNDGFTQDYSETSPSFTFGLGWQLTPRLAIETDFRYLGRFSSIGGYRPDGMGESNFNCGKVCLPAVWTYIRGSSGGFGLSAVGNYPLGNLKLTGRLGAFAHKSTSKVTVISGEMTSTDPSTFTDSGVDPFAGIGIEYRNVTMEVDYFHELNTRGGMYQNGYTVTVGYKF